jgi:hypothetical protein
VPKECPTRAHSSAFEVTAREVRIERNIDYSRAGGRWQHDHDRRVERPTLNHRRKSRSEALLARTEPVPGGDTGCKGFKRLEPRTSRSGRVPTSPGEEERHRLHPVSQFESSSAGTPTS